MPSNTEATSPHPPRLCHITRSPDFNGYGFNLHTIKNKSGQFIGQVDAGSPAQKALLKEGDRIVEVNGVNIASENHKQVVSRIKLVPNETKLLVVDDQADKWYKQHNVVISSSLPEVVKGYSNKSRHPSTSSSEPDVKEIKQEDRRSVDSGSSAATSETSHRQSPLSASPSPPSSVGAPSPTPYTFTNTDGLNMNMSAAQMREYLASKKKKDIRTSEIDMRKKYEIIQKL